jgi:hypothetical protein
MSTSKNQFAGSGTKTAALAYAGVPTPGQDATEEYTGAGAPVTSYNHSFLTLDLIFNNHIKKESRNDYRKKKHPTFNRKRRRTSS